VGGICSIRLKTVAAFVLGAAAACLLASASSARVDASVCAAWVAPNVGSDTAPGTQSLPYLTVGKLLSALKPGQTGCISSGAIVSEHVVVASSGATGRPITLTSAPNAQGAVLTGGVEFATSVHDVIIRHVAIRAPATPSSPAAIVVLRGVRNQILDSNINGSATPDRSQACIYLDHANRVTIDHNSIQECSKSVNDPTIYAPGIQDAISVKATITNNVIDNQYSDAVALSPRAQYTTVRNNTMQNDGSGIFFGGDDKAASSDNTVTHNTIGVMAAFSVHASYAAGAPVGKRNMVTANCVWRAGTAQFGGAASDAPGFTAKGNVTASPSSPKCASNRPSFTTAKPSAPKPRPQPPLSSGLSMVAGGAWYPSGPGNTARPGDKVEVSLAYLSGARAGALVTIRCVKGCSVKESYTATGDKVAVLAKTTLAVGNVIEARATKPGYVGVVARFTVSPTTTNLVRLSSSGCLKGAKPVSCP
jgi:Right handed beta helix region